MTRSRIDECSLRRMTDSEIDHVVDEWAKGVSEAERGDPVWTLLAYRTARYALQLATDDVYRLPRWRSETGDQLIRAVGSVSANLGEGYGRPTAADQSRFYSYALGSVRESLTWYATMSKELGAVESLARTEVLSRVRRLTFGLLRSSRERRTRPAPRPSSS
jgi:four helix bundle protein